MVWTGENPYFSTDWINGHHLNGVTWIPNSKFVYPLPLTLFYAPLGILPYFEAYIIYVFLLEVMLLLSTYWLIHQLPENKVNPYLLPVFAGVILFRPIFSALFGGQISIALLFIMTIITILWSKNKWFLGSVLLPIVALKPNIGVPIVLVLSSWFILKKNIKVLSGLIVSSFLLLGIGFFQNPHWISEYWNIGNTKLSQNFGLSPTIWGLASILTDFNPQVTLKIGVILTILILIFTGLILFKVRKFASSTWIISIAITTSLLLTPYTWSYDQVLLIIPILWLISYLIKINKPFLLNATVFLLIDFFALFLLYISAQMKMEIINFLLPLVIWLGLIFALLDSKKRMDTLVL